MRYLYTHGESLALGTDHVYRTPGVAYDLIDDRETDTEPPIPDITRFGFVGLIEFLLQIRQIRCPDAPAVVLEYEDIRGALMEEIHP